MFTIRLVIQEILGMFHIIFLFLWAFFFCDPFYCSGLKEQILLKGLYQDTFLSLAFLSQEQTKLYGSKINSFEYYF